MQTRIVFEIIGYVGTALVLVSFLMSSVYKLRVINTIGSIVSIVYGVLLHVYPTVVLNAALALINIFYLWKLSSGKAERMYSTQAVSPSNSVVNNFLHKYEKEIKKYFPHFDVMNNNADTARLVFCEDAFAGVLIGKTTGDTLDVYLDFTTPAYRDFSAGKYLYKDIQKSGIKKCIFKTDIPLSYVYLRKVGYKRIGDEMVLEWEEN